LETLGYPESGTELTEPYLVFYIDAQPAWYVRAQSGQVSEDRQTVWLLGETRLWRYNALNEWELQVVTRDVMLKPEDQYAQTDAPALITAPGGFMQGVGLRAYLPERRLELLAQVKGQYEKP
jgi:lipopolysaccharide export system protein LptC